MKTGDLIVFSLPSLKEGTGNSWSSRLLYGIIIDVNDFTATVIHNGQTHFWPVDNCELVSESR
jgi:hypothetical protein